ncbi:MAG TPA: O-acetylhomoserine aminocarboxypropyltransferase [Gammaproteobacteria bacterium]|jgi:O-acetylhomoserine (thiol)-lyase|nr:O-acetylhomoserine aminocarboxypropyltransferase [Gammaproteobacteria bacterium]MDA0827190.1 O-acetylhomoserine aminocarboxypropyltransferase [Pseudomonadota bacterium]MDA8912365.1 O-acetylhomoserine aminocarboxypropyltransferase [Pseudomonadales bacterium]MDB3978898.1 O-acetylhomoserine aminocarboxypropyltransferase [Pseudomonadales bacterium]MDC1102153.1 O-acetylhomoserine aminocarboxypropyltransferase [Pseudomonadales bacterium]
MSKPPFEFDTLALHAGQRPDAETGARATPIYQSASFVFESAEAAAGLFNLERTGHVYSRLSNPTNAVLEERIAVLDQGVGAVAVASGQAAMHLAVATLMGAGDHIVASRSLYGGTHNLLSYTLPRFGIKTTFVDPRDPAAFAAAIQDNTKLVFGEVVGNPGMEVLDIPAIAEVAHAAGIPVMIDATFTTPYLCRPIELGADLVMHSATKFLSGHGIVIGGLLVDGGVFDWAASGRFPTLAEPFDGFHHLNFAEEFGPAAFIARARREGLRDFGACMAPTTAFHILQGIETLSLRMARHMENAEQIAKFLSEQAGVLSVLHPCLPSHPDYELAKKLLPRGAGAVMSFEIAGGREAGVRFIEGLKIFSHLANVGDAKSLVIHPASTTHHRMDAEALVAAGISEGMIRLSIGLEDAADLIKDLKAGLRSAAKGGR